MNDLTIFLKACFVTQKNFACLIVRVWQHCDSHYL